VLCGALAEMSKESSNRPIVFELNRLAEYTDEAILAELCRVASLIKDQPLTVRAFGNHSLVNRSTVVRRFGSWAKALAAAGLSKRSSEELRLRGRKDDEILHALRDLAERLGKPELTVADVESALPFGGGTLRRRWGSSGRAFEAAGLSVSSHGRRYSDEECFANMLEVWTHFGRPPQYREMSELPSKVGAKAYVLRFGSWNKALAAFADRVNAEEVPVKEPIRLTNYASDEQISEPIETQVRDRREIPLGLRFRVLYRDRFKCVLCGNSPSANALCVLHVDHIIPWSKGGRTIFENLRSLCDSCNVGRGNRYDD
jgi:hypothetical protein